MKLRFGKVVQFGKKGFFFHFHLFPQIKFLQQYGSCTNLQPEIILLNCSRSVFMPKMKSNAVWERMKLEPIVGTTKTGFLNCYASLGDHAVCKCRKKGVGSFPCPLSIQVWHQCWHLWEQRRPFSSLLLPSNIHGPHQKKWWWPSRQERPHNFHNEYLLRTFTSSNSFSGLPSGPSGPCLVSAIADTNLQVQSQKEKMANINMRLKYVFAQKERFFNKK